MDIYLLKFSACLLVFWLVYVLLLEQQKMHRFKRFYLLGSFSAALIIPLLTITYYVEPVVQNFQGIPLYIPMDTLAQETPTEGLARISLETVLWYIYGLGALIFSVRFFVNLIKLYFNILRNEKVMQQSFIYVLLKEYRIPHSFFKYIFLNKVKYNNDKIPKEVLLHEETHAKQLHSLDIILIELLQIVFWFHPLIYILKQNVKLNHEFLADQSVLNQGIEAKTYQHILLQFSSNTQDFKLSSAINYSSFKKRFTVMKTQTSKTRNWLSILLLIPISAILYYGFAENEYVERDYLLSNLSEVSKSQLDKVKTYREAVDNYNKAVRLFINDNRYIDDERAKHLKSVADDLFKSFSDEEKTQFNIFKTRPIPYSDEDATDLFYYNEPVLRIDSEQNLWLNDKKTTLETLEEDFNSIIKFAGTGVRLKTEKRESADLVEKIMSALGPNLSVLAFSPKEATVYNSNYKQEKATEKEIAAYNAWAKKIHNESKKLSVDATWYPPIDEQDLIKFSKIYKRMSAQQKKQAVVYPFPDMELSGSEKNISVSEQQKATKEQIAEYNAWAKKINIAIKKANESKSYEYPIIKLSEVKPYMHIYNNLMTDEQRKNAEPFPNIPPPPPPPPSEEQKRPTVIEFTEYNTWAKKLNTAMAKAEKINDYSNMFVKQSEIKKYKAIYNSMSEAHKKTSEPWPSFPPPPPKPEKALKEDKKKPNTDSPKIYINNRELVGAKIVLTRLEIKKLQLTLSTRKIVTFKLKIPGVKTDFIKGNTISNKSIANLSTMKKGGNIAIFDIKDSNGSQIPPIIIEVKD